MAVAVSTIGALPALLIGSMALLVQGDLGFDAGQLGVAVGAYYVPSILLSVPAGIASERYGPTATIIGGTLFIVGGMIGIALLANSWPALVAFLLVGGGGHRVAQVGVNHLIATTVESRRHGIAFGLKQSAPPIAGLLSGIALPTLGLAVGWRSTFLIAAFLGVSAILFVDRSARYSTTDRSQRHVDVPLHTLSLVALGSGLGAAASTALAAFAVDSAVTRGLSLSMAGALLAVGSAVAVLVRIGGGWIADRIGKGSLVIASAMMAVGTIGYGMLALDTLWIQPLGSLLAFAGGWGYPGIILLTLVRSNPSAPAAAMAFASVGPSLGAVVGPPAFGTMAELHSYSAAWIVAALASFLGLVLLLIGRIMLIKDREARKMRPSVGG